PKNSSTIMSGGKMNRERLFATVLAKSRSCAFATACIMLLAFFGLTQYAAAKTRQQKNANKSKPASAPVSKSKNDEAYGAKIKEYTTEKYFMTELVDHLPTSDTVPSPDKVLGYVIGTPNKLT